MQIFETDSGRIWGFEGFEKISHARMLCLERISIRDGHARGVGGIEFEWMQILDENSGRIGRFEGFEKTLHARMRCLESIFTGMDTLVALEELNFGRCKSLMRILKGLGYLISLKKHNTQE